MLERKLEDRKMQEQNPEMQEWKMQNQNLLEGISRPENVGLEIALPEV